MATTTRRRDDDDANGCANARRVENVE